MLLSLFLLIFFFPEYIILVSINFEIVQRTVYLRIKGKRRKKKESELSFVLKSYANQSCYTVDKGLDISILVFECPLVPLDLDSFC